MRGNGVQDSLTRAVHVARAHPFAAFAYCAYTVWWSFALLGPLFSTSRDDTVLLLVAVPYALIGVICLVIALAFKHWRLTFDRGEHRVLVCACMTVGTLCQAAFSDVVATGHGGMSAWIAYLLGYALIAVGVSFFRIEMDRVFGWVGAERTMHIVSAGTLLNLPAAALLMLIPDSGAFGLAALLPTAATCLLRLETRAFPQATYYAVRHDIELPVPSQFIATSFVQGVANGIFYAPIAAGLAGIVASPLGSPASLVSWPAGVAIAYAVTLVLRMDFNRLIYKVGFPLIALSFVLIALLPDSSAGFVADLAFYMAAVYTDVILWSLGAFIMHDMGVPVCWIASFPGAALFGGTAAGALVVWLVATLSADAHLQVEIVLMLLAACMMLGASLALLSNRNLTSGWGTFRLGAREGLATELDVALTHIAGEYDLTPRESDVVRKLAVGLTRAEAAERLGVSEETVKTHMRAIYRKLDVHSQAELVSFVEQARHSLGDSADMQPQPTTGPALRAAPERSSGRLLKRRSI